MARWHLDELRDALERRGWRFEGELPGDGHAISATWSFRRSAAESPLLIDLDGLDDLRTFPLEESYGCQARGRGGALYFRRRGHRGSRSRGEWLTELSEFIGALDRGGRLVDRDQVQRGATPDS